MRLGLLNLLLTHDVAFARDGGLPASDFLRKIHPTLKTPVATVRVSGALAVEAT